MSAEESKPQPAPQTPPSQSGQQRPPRDRGPDQRGDRRGPRPEGEGRRHEGPRPKRSPEDRNVIFIGNKPPMNYVLAVVTQFNGGSDEVVIRARGKAIAPAVDVAEIVRNKFFQQASVKNVSIGTETVTGDDGRKRAVSAIEIRLLSTGGKAGSGTGSPASPGAGSPQKPPVEPATPEKSGGI